KLATSFWLVLGIYLFIRVGWPAGYQHPLCTDALDRSDDDRLWLWPGVDHGACISPQVLPSDRFLRHRPVPGCRQFADLVWPGKTGESALCFPPAGPAKISAFTALSADDSWTVNCICTFCRKGAGMVCRGIDRIRACTA